MSDVRDANVVYRTVQRSPGLGGDYAGPVFDNAEAAKETLESFATGELGATPTGWQELDDGSFRMETAGTRHVLVVEAKKLRRRSSEVVPKKEAVPA